MKTSLRFLSLVVYRIDAYLKLPKTESIWVKVDKRTTKNNTLKINMKNWISFITKFIFGT